MTGLPFVADRRSDYSPTRLPAESSLARPAHQSLRKQDVHVWLGSVNQTPRSDLCGRSRTLQEVI